MASHRNLKERVRSMVKRILSPDAQGTSREIETSTTEIATVVDEIINKLIADYHKTMVGSLEQTLAGTINQIVQALILATVNKLTTIAEQQTNLFDGERFMPFPDGTKFYLPRQNETVFVIEHKPQIRTLNFNCNSYFDLNNQGPRQLGIGAAKQFHLAFPYVIFVVSIDNSSKSLAYPTHPTLWVFQRTMPLRSIEDELCLMNLFNVHDTGVVCLGSYMPLGNKPSPAERAFHVVDFFWKAVFTSGHPENFNQVQKRDPRYRNLAAWEKASRENPAFPLEVKWPAIGPLQNVIGQRQQIDRRLAEVKTAIEQSAGTYRADLANAVTARGKQLQIPTGSSTQRIKPIAQAFANRLCYEHIKMQEIHLGSDPMFEAIVTRVVQKELAKLLQRNQGSPKPPF